MPTINIEILEGRTREQKKALVRGITDIVCDILKIDPQTVNIRIFDLKRSETARGGEFFSEINSSGASK
ncbi:MAG: tautomerase family protein [Desulforhabdus sp.]|jgi:4-oxalocrotonate tautomerase|nr:tautomerase family protein [Desulforhabdus sp.]